MGLGKTAQSERRRRGRIRRREKENLTNQEEKKEGERREGRNGESRPADWQPDPVGVLAIFDEFWTIFPANCFKKPHGKHSRSLPLSIPSQNWRDLALKIEEHARRGAADLASNHPIPKQFLSIVTTHSILLRPRTKPKHYLEHRS
ncbi:hypothetical protein ACFX2B_045999 [Malus domestica]